MHPFRLHISNNCPSLEDWMRECPNEELFDQEAYFFTQPENSNGWISINDGFPEEGKEIFWRWLDGRFTVGKFEYTEDGFPVVRLSDSQQTYGVHNLPFYLLPTNQ